LGAIKGNVSYTRLYVWGELEGAFQDRFMRSIKNRVFEPLVAQEPDEEHSGWVSIADPFDLDLTRDKVFLNNFLNLSLRIDKWRLPKPVFDAHFAEAERQHLERKGRERLGRKEKEELRMFVAKRLRKQVIPAMKVVDMSWDLDAGLVRFWSNSPKMHERLFEIFEKTFKLKLVPESPYANAVRVGISEPQALSLLRLDLSKFHGPDESGLPRVARRSQQQEEEA
jgi:DNA recombination-dependent growth factor C